MLQEEHSAILLTFIKLPFVIRSLFCLFLSGRFTQVLFILLAKSSAKVLNKHINSFRVGCGRGEGVDSPYLIHKALLVR